MYQLDFSILILHMFKERKVLIEFEVRVRGFSNSVDLVRSSNVLNFVCEDR